MKIKQPYLSRFSLLCLTSLCGASASFADVKYVYEQTAPETAEIHTISNDRSFKADVLAVRSEDGKCVDFQKEGEGLFRVCSENEGFVVSEGGLDSRWTEMKRSEGNVIEWKNDQEVRQIVKKVDGDEISFYENDQLIAQAKHSEGNSELNVLTPVRENEVVRQALPNAFWFSLWSPLLLAETPVIEQHQGEAGLLPVEKTLVAKSKSKAGIIAGSVIGGTLGLLTAAALTFRAVKHYKSLPIKPWLAAETVHLVTPVLNSSEAIEAEIEKFLSKAIGLADLRTVIKTRGESNAKNFRNDSQIWYLLQKMLSTGEAVSGTACVEIEHRLGSVKMTVSFGRLKLHRSTLEIEYSVPGSYIVDPAYKAVSQSDVFDAVARAMNRMTNNNLNL